MYQEKYTQIHEYFSNDPGIPRHYDLLLLK